MLKVLDVPLFYVMETTQRRVGETSHLVVNKNQCILRRTQL